MTETNETAVLQQAADIIMQQWGIRTIRRDLHRGEWDVVSVATGRVYSGRSLVSAVIAMRCSEGEAQS